MLAAVLFKSDQSRCIWFSSGIELKPEAGVNRCKPSVEEGGGGHPVFTADAVEFSVDEDLCGELEVPDDNAPGRGRSSGVSRVGAR